MDKGFNLCDSVSRTHLNTSCFFSVPPMIWIQNQLVGAHEGQQMTLECHSEAYPKSINYWTREKGDIIAQGNCCISRNLNPYRCSVELSSMAHLHQVQCPAQVDTLFYSVLFWFSLSSCCLVAAFKVCRLGIFGTFICPRLLEIITIIRTPNV
jgi:hypothetical protein